VGTAFSYQITASNNPISYAATNLPSGLSVNSSTGLISGTPTATGTSSVTISATNAGGTGSATLTVTIAAAVSASFVQTAAKGFDGPATSFSVSFPANTTAGDLILVAFDYNSGVAPISVTDSQGNAFTPVGNQLITPGGTPSRVYYAKNIRGGADTVTVTLSANSGCELYLSEYSGTDPNNPIDAQAGASGSAGAVTSGTATTTAAGDVIYGYCVGDWSCTAGPGFATRSSLDGNLLEDKLAGSAGSYAATGTANNGWTMQMVALKPASGSGVMPPVITSSTSATGTVSTAFSYQITATNSPTSFGATGLPAGLTVNSSNGLIFGTPTTTGTSSVTLNASNSGGTSNATLTLTINNPLPAISSFSPNSAIAGAAAQTLTINGTNFVSGSTVTYNGVAHAATFISPSESTIQLSAADQATSGNYPIIVTNPPPGGGSSAAANFPVTTGGGTTITLFPLNLYFGPQAISTSSPGQAVTLNNTGSVTLNISSFAFTGANQADFAQTNTCGSSLAAGGSCSITVTYTASSASTESATLTLSSDAQSGPQSVGLMGGGQFMALSSDGTHLVNTFTNQPVFITGDSAWSLITQLDNADVDVYLSARAAQGYNYLWCAAADNYYQTNAPANYYGNVPFDGADFTNFDSAYWAHVDYVIQRAAAYGFTVALDPGFVGLSSPGGYLQSYLNSTDAVVTAYGAFLGSRYKNYPNIIWALGGDVDPSTGVVPKITDLANGIRSVDTVDLITAEGYPQQAALDTYSGLSWLQLNWLYLHTSNIPGAANSNYTRTPFLPPFLGESWYENDSGITQLQLREQGYWGVLGGAYLGNGGFGNDPLWFFNGGPDEVSGDPTWQSQLTSAGSLAQEYLGALFRSREHWKLVPDLSSSVVTSCVPNCGSASSDTLVAAARTSDGQTIIAYIPNGNATTISVNLTTVTSATSTVHGWWFNPQTGAATDLGTFANSGTMMFAPPDGNDWVLVLDDANAALPAPGSANY
jgi:hypothetical protein